jgi:hypothetical protein
LNPVIGTTTSSPDYIQYQAATVGTIDEEQNHRSWIDMLMSTDEKIRGLAEDLLRYAFLTGGVQDANSFVKFVPVSYLANTTFGEMLKAQETQLREHGEDPNGLGTAFEAFAKQFIQHNPELALQVNQSIFGELAEGEDYPEVFKVNTDEGSPSVIRSSDGTLVNFISYRSKVEGNTYKLYQKTAIGESTYYVRIDTLGNQYTDEYNGNIDTSFRSVFTENRSLAEGITMTDENWMTIDPGYQEPERRNYYDEIGIREGTIKRTLLTIADNPNVNEYFRTSARILGTLEDSAELKAARAVINPGYNPQVKFTDIKALGSMSTTGLLQINPKNASSTFRAAQTVMHEVFHDKLQSIIMAGGFDSRIYDAIQQMTPAKQVIAKKELSDFADKYPEVIKHLEQLDRIRYEARSAMRTRICNPCYH